MIRVKKEGIILEATKRKFENDAVLNPACYQDGNKVHMFYRAVQKGNKSTIGYCLLEGPLKVVHRNEQPVIVKEKKYESQGIEDPRIVKIDDTFYLTYTAFDGKAACGAYAISKDLKQFEKKGQLTPRLSYNEFRKFAGKDPKVNPKYFRFYEFYHMAKNLDKKIIVWDKDLVFYPRKINRKFTFLHRFRPDIQVVSVEKLSMLTKSFWRKYIENLKGNTLMHCTKQHELSYIGSGCPPIETKEGWLIIYHGVTDGPEGFIYNACAALFDKKNIMKEIGRLKKPLFSPTEEWEINGDVRDVVFPTGTAIFNDRLYIYYGAADKRIACASVNLKILLKELKKKSNMS
ncbi:MAG: pesticidal protein Cry7Aa [Bacteroidetes bacterium]|nr:pesticidal protein Cry7Aa [Bacteroidota bacterium]